MVQCKTAQPCSCVPESRSLFGIDNQRWQQGINQDNKDYPEEVDMNTPEEMTPSRKDILFRLLYTVLYLVIFEIIKFIVQIAVVFQYIFLLITLDFSAPVRHFSNKLATYTYDVIRYLTLNKNLRPFPFNDYPEPIEEPVEEVTFR